MCFLSPGPYHLYTWSTIYDNKQGKEGRGHLSWAFPAGTKINFLPYTTYRMDRAGDKKHLATTVCGNVNLCAGLRAGIEGNLHLPLLKRMQAVAVPYALAPAYADDTAAAGKAMHNAACLSFLLRHGPRYGYFPDPGKSWYIYKAEDKEVARQAFEVNDLDIQYSHGQRYLGGFIGINASKVDWLSSMVTTWVAAVDTLASVASNYPQAAYAGFTFCLQNEW